MPTFQAYWGKPAVGNDRVDHGNGGIIRSPICAMVLPGGRAGLARAQRTRDSRPARLSGLCRSEFSIGFPEGVRLASYCAARLMSLEFKNRKRIWPSNSRHSHNT